MFCIFNKLINDFYRDGDKTIIFKNYDLADNFKNYSGYKDHLIIICLIEYTEIKNKLDYYINNVNEIINKLENS